MNTIYKSSMRASHDKSPDEESRRQDYSAYQEVPIEILRNNFAENEEEMSKGAGGGIQTLLDVATSPQSPVGSPSFSFFECSAGATMIDGFLMQRTELLGQ